MGKGDEHEAPRDNPFKGDVVAAVSPVGAACDDGLGQKTPQQKRHVKKLGRTRNKNATLTGAR